MTAILVIICNDFTHDSVKLRLVKDDNFVQQLSTQGPSEPLHEWVLPRTPGSCPHRIHAHALQCRGYFVTVLAIPVQNRVARCRIEGESFAQLLNDPRRVRMVGYREMQNPPSFMV